MFLLAESRNNLVTFVLQPRNYTQLYNKMKTVLSAEQYTFFARPDVFTDKANWSSEIDPSLNPGEAKTFEQLSDEDKDTIADYVEALKAEIAEKLDTNNEFSGILKDLFLVPSTKDIVAVKTDRGLKAVLTQWGCKSNEIRSVIDPISVVINRPRVTTAKVLIEVYYSDGSKAINKPFYIEYNERQSKEKTNKEGLYDRGRCRLNTSFEVFDQISGQKAYTHVFTVTQEGRYVVTFPMFTNGFVKVLNQKNTPMPGVDVLVDLDGRQMVYTTGNAGNFDLEDLEVGKEIAVRERDNPENSQVYTILKGKNEFILNIFRPIFTKGTVKVVDEKEEAQLHYPVLVEYEGSQKEIHTGETGVADLDSIEVGKQIRIWDKRNNANVQTHTITEERNEYVLKIEKPVTKFVQVKLINHKNQPLPGIPIDFQYSGQTTSLDTNDEGMCILPHESFTDQEKVKATVHVPKVNKKGEKREKLVNKRFEFKAEQLDYVLKLRKISRWWLLLLLLLIPLLLLIRCEKTVYVKTIDAELGNPAPGADVFFRYQKAFLYDSSRFFVNDTVRLRKVSDVRGVATFERLEYSVYSWVFKHFSKTLVFAQSGCFASDTLTPYFHHISKGDTLYLKLHPLFIPLDFKVIDKEDGQPLPDAQVDIISEVNGNQYTESAISDPNGRVVFKKIPRCGKVVKVIANEEGYFPDSLMNKSVAELLKGDVNQSRLLQLIPKKGQFSFFVIDCKTKRPIAGATVTIEIDYNGKKSSKTKKTNVDGKGKGYDEDYTIAKIHLIGKAPYYKTGELPDWHQIIDIIDSTKYPDAKRTFCLEPEENCVDFKNIDERTGKPLSGVTNIVTIRNGLGARTDTVISGSDGGFPVCSVVVGDKISIVSQYPPDYEDNNMKIQDADGIALLKAPVADRTIPLKPKEVDLTFRTVDEQDGSLVPDADLSVYFDGVQQPAPTNSGTGVFTVRVPVTALISIGASKAGYGSNTTKINNTPAKVLIDPPTPQSDRDIPLQQQTAIACDQPVSAGLGTSSEMYFRLGSQSYDFTLEYEMFGHPDELTIYCGHGTSGSVLFKRMIGNSEGSPLQIHFDAAACSGEITVTVESQGDDPGSKWYFKISCPPNQ